MAITTTNLKAAIEAKIAAATSGTSLEDLTVIKADADLYIRSTAGSITGYSTLEGLIQTKENALTGSSTLDDITLTGVAAFPPTTSSGGSGGSVFKVKSRVIASIAAGVTGDILTLTPPALQSVRLQELFSVSGQAGISIEVEGNILVPATTLAGATPTGSQFFVSDVWTTASLTSLAVARVSPIVANEIKIIKNAGNTAQVISYLVEYGVIE